MTDLELLRVHLATALRVNRSIHEGYSRAMAVLRDVAKGLCTVTPGEADQVIIRYSPHGAETVLPLSLGEPITSPDLANLTPTGDVIAP